MTEQAIPETASHMPEATRIQPEATAEATRVQMPLGTGVPPFTTILWDLDGTISDSAPGIIESIRKMLDIFRLPVPPYEELVSYIGPPILESFRKHDLNDQVELATAMETYREIYRTEGAFNSQIYPGIREILRDAHERGIWQSTATSKNENSAVMIMNHYDITKYFNHTAGASDDEAISAKTEVIAEALRRLRESGADLSNTIMIGDRFYDVQGALEHGIPAIYVTWGYGNLGEEAGSVAVATTPEELRGFLGL